MLAGNLNRERSLAGFSILRKVNSDDRFSAFRRCRQEPARQMGTLAKAGLANNFTPVVHVIPDNVTIKIIPRGEKHAATRAFCQAVSKLNILRRLRPTW